VQNPADETRIRSAIRRDAVALCDALGYDMNTVELAVRGAFPYAIDFNELRAGRGLFSSGRANFEWCQQHGRGADRDCDRSTSTQLTGSWPKMMPVDKPVRRPLSSSA